MQNGKKESARNVKPDVLLGKHAVKRNSSADIPSRHVARVAGLKRLRNSSVVHEGKRHDAKLAPTAKYISYDTEWIQVLLRGDGSLSYERSTALAGE